MRYLLLTATFYGFGLLAGFAQSPAALQKTPISAIEIYVDDSDDRVLYINKKEYTMSRARAWLAEASVHDGRNVPVLIFMDRKTHAGTIADLTYMASMTHDGIFTVLKPEAQEKPFLLFSLSSIEKDHPLFPLLPARTKQASLKFLQSQPINTLGAPLPVRPNPDTTIPLSAKVLTEIRQTLTPSITPDSKSSKMPSEDHNFSETYQFIFFAVLEGLYHEGVSDTDVDALLLQNDEKSYVNFIYACPICSPTLFAIQTYKNRPQFTSLKLHNYQTEQRTFGYGLLPETSKLLHSENPKDRLKALYSLVNLWISYRMDKMNLSVDDRNKLLHKIEKDRKSGAQLLESFSKNGTLKDYAPSYSADDECVICNAAAQMPLHQEEKGTPAKP